MNRRKYIRSSLAASAIALSGCSQMTRNESGVKLEQVWIVNRSNKNQKTHIKIEFNNKKVYENMVSVKKKTNGTITPTKKIGERLPDEQGRWYVHAKSLTQKNSRSVEMNVNEFKETGCTFATVQYDSSEDLSIGLSDNCSALRN